MGVIFKNTITSNYLRAILVLIFFLQAYVGFGLIFHSVFWPVVYYLPLQTMRFVDAGMLYGVLAIKEHTNIQATDIWVTVAVYRHYSRATTELQK